MPNELVISPGFIKVPDIIKKDLLSIINSFAESPYMANVNKIILFGRFAKDSYQPDSDIDLAVLLKELPPADVKIEYYSIVDIGREVDLLFCTEQNLNSGKYVYKNILNEGIVIYENL